MKAAVCLCLAAGAAAVACSSQIDSIPTPVVRSSSTTPGGVYFGTLSSQSGTSSPVIGLVDENSHIVAYADNGSYLLSGLYTATTGSSGLTAQVHDFPLTGSGAMTNLNLSGTYVPQSQILVSYTSSSGDAGSISLSYQTAIYEQPSATADLAGTWVVQDAFGDTLERFSIDNTGNVSGSTTSPACTYNGTAAVLDLRYNLYSVSLSENCTTTTSSGGSTSTTAALTGLATILPPSTTVGNTKNELVLTATNASEARLFTLSPGT